MSLDSIIRSKAYKNTTAKLYGIGAAIVIMGALFKINHYPGANEMLIVGMTIESIIFFVSAFEPLHVEYDWSLAYPELAGMEDEEAKAKRKKKKEEKELAKSGNAVQQLDKMLSEAKIGPELIESLGKGLQNLSETAGQLGNVSNAAVASERFTQSMTEASSSVEELSSAYKKTAENLNQDLLVSGEYLASVQDATSAVSTLANIYKETASALSSGDVTYLEELKVMASSLSSINALYEMQIQNSSSQLEATKLVQERIDNLVMNFADTAENVLRYKEQVNALSKKVGALNDIYGNMLAAMQVKA
jgi:gliding motility-associated protein GldL